MLYKLAEVFIVCILTLVPIGGMCLLIDYHRNNNNFTN